MLQNKPLNWVASGLLLHSGFSMYIKGRCAGRGVKFPLIEATLSHMCSTPARLSKGHGTMAALDVVQQMPHPG